MILEDPCDKVIRVIKGNKYNKDFLYEEKIALIDFMLKRKVSALHRLSNHLVYERYEKGKTIYSHMDQIDKVYILLKGKVALFESKDVEETDYQRLRGEQFDYKRANSQQKVNQLAQQLKKRCEISSYDCFGYNTQNINQDTNCINQVSDHTALVLEFTHLLIIQAKYIQQYFFNNHLLNCEYLSQKLKVQQTLLNDLICEQCFMKKGMFICQETQNPRFIYCILFGSVICQNQFSTGINKNRAILEEGQIIGQSQEQQISQSPKNMFKQKDQFGNSIQQQVQISQNQGQDQHLNANDQVVEQEQYEKNQPSIYSLSEYTIVLMIDRDKLIEKLKKQNQKLNISQYKFQNEIKNSQQLNSKLQHITRQSSNHSISKLYKVSFSKKNRSQSHQTLNNLIENEEKQNSIIIQKNQLDEYMANQQNLYLQQINLQKLQDNSISQYYQTVQQTQLPIQNIPNHESENQFQKNNNEINQKVQEKRTPINSYQEYIYNKVIIKNLREKEQMARMIIDSKKPINLQTYFSNPENYIKKNELMQQFHIKYIEHNIKEKSQKNNQSLRNQSSDASLYIQKDQNNSIYNTHNDFSSDHFQKTMNQTINSDLINSQRIFYNTQDQFNSFSDKQINNEGLLSSQKVKNQNEKQNNNHKLQLRKRIYTDNTQCSSNINNSGIETQHISKYFTQNNQKLFYPYKAQELMDQFMSQKTQDTFQNNTNTKNIQIRIQSNPNLQLQFSNQASNTQLIQKQTQKSSINSIQINQHPRQLNLNQNNQNNGKQKIPNNSSVPSISDKFGTYQNFDEKVTNNNQQNTQLRSNQTQYNESKQYHQDDLANQNQFELNNQNQLINKTHQIFPSKQLTRVNSVKFIQNTISGEQIPQLQNISQYNVNKHQKQFKSYQQRSQSVNSANENINIRSCQSINICDNKITKSNIKAQDQCINKVQQDQEFRLKKKQENQLNKILSTECRDTNLFLQQKQPSAQITHSQYITQQNSLKSSRRSSNFKIRPPTSNSETQNMSLTHRQILLEQFKSNLTSSDRKKITSKHIENDHSNSIQKSILFNHTQENNNI